MTLALTQYLDSVRDNLRLDLPTEREIIRELQSHLEDKLEEIQQAGLSEEEAANVCVSFLGSAKMVARKIYEAHSQGTWKEALLASLPHILFALLFTLNYWRGIGWLIITTLLVLGIAIYGWWHGKPVWLFPWLGYSLVPVVVSALLLFYLPARWSWLAIIIYIPLALWLAGAIIIQTIKKDWLYSALMLLPVPIIISWFLVIGQEGRLPEINLERISHFAPWIGLSFSALALTAAAFIRLRQRWLRATLLFLSGLLTLIVVAWHTEGEIGLSALSILILIMLGVILIPALAERRIRYGRRRTSHLGNHAIRGS